MDSETNMNLLDHAFLSLSDSEDSDDSEIIELTPPVEKKPKPRLGFRPTQQVKENLPITNNNSKYPQSSEILVTEILDLTPIQKRPKYLGIRRALVRKALAISNAHSSKSSRLFVSQALKSRNIKAKLPKKKNNHKELGTKPNKNLKKCANSKTEKNRELVGNWLMETFEEVNDKKAQIPKETVRQLYNEKFQENAVSVNLFGRILFATFALVTPGQGGPKINGKRPYVYKNLKIKES